MRKLFCFCIFYFFLSALLSAQTFPYRQYTTADELANSNIYDIEQDEEGFLWFATDNGISRFDGSKFTNYNMNDGLPDNTVTTLCTDEDGNIWAGIKSKGIMKFDNGKFRAIVTDTFFRYFNNKILVHQNIIYSLHAGRTIYAFDARTGKYLQDIEFSQRAVPSFLYFTKNGDIVAGTTKGVYEVKGLKAQPYEVPGLNYSNVNYITQNADTLIITTANELCWVYDHKCVKKIKFPELSGKPINNILVDNYGSIWLSTYEGNKLYYFKHDSLQELNERLDLFNTSVNDMLEDAEGNIWFATYGKGIYCFHHLYCTNFNAHDGLRMPYVTAINAVGDMIYVGTYDGLYTYNGRFFVQRKFNSDHLEYIKNISVADHTIFVSCTAASKNVALKFGDKNLYFINASTCLPENDTKYIAGGWRNRIMFFDGGKYDSVQLSQGITRNRINTIYKDASGDIWCGTQNGLYIYSANKPAQKVDIPGLNDPVLVIAADRDNNLWLGSAKGVIKYNTKAVNPTEKWNMHICKNSGKIQNVTSIVFDAENRPWIGTLSGLYLIENNESVLLNANSCLLSEEVYALNYNAETNMLWVGTNAGLSRINIAEFDALPSYAPKVSFRNIRTQDGLFRADIDTILPYNRNNITLRFSAIHFTNPLAVRFYFKLDNGIYQPAVGRQVDFAGLGYGRHTITLIAENDRGLESAPAEITVTIATPYWATWWFKALIFIIAAGIVTYGVRWRFRYEKKKQKEQLELQTKISELRHQALNTSMNPHFIFNSLNSIQQFINSHDTEEASEYLGKFARLIRLQLNSGNKTFITLEEELDRMNRYLELEKIRFGDKLNYTIHVQKSIDTKNIEIPNMILQPFIENAIWHGILPLHHPGTINIDFTKQNGTLKVFVEDNGIGIKESEQRKKTNHRSLGMQMILERVQLLKKLNGNDISIEVKDKSETVPDAHGTTVEIELTVQKRIN